MANSTPLPKKVEEAVVVKGMSFYEALEKLSEGKKIRRIDWEDKSIYGVLDKERVCIVDSVDKKLHPWFITQADLEGMDWVLV